MSIPGSALPLLLTSAAGGGSAVPADIERSLRFNSGDSAHLTKTLSSSGDRKKFTFSCWAKLGDLSKQKNIFTASAGAGSSSPAYARTEFRFTANSGILFAVNSSGSWKSLNTNAVFRDTGAWYHVVVAVDTSQSTDSDRVNLYVNGVEQSLTGTYPGLDELTPYNTSNGHAIGAYANNYNDFFDGYLADVYFVDGQQLTADDFGASDATTGAWNPIEYSGTYGTNGFHLLFDNTSNLGEDSAGSNDWTANNFSVTAGTGNDSLFDSPTNGTQTDTGAGGEVSGGYCVWNPNDSSGNVITISNGNLETTNTTATSDNIRGTIGISSGKWYWEVEITSFAGGFHVGLAKPDAVFGSSYVGGVAGSWAYADSGNKAAEGTVSSYGSSFASVGSKVGIAFNADAGSVFFYLNGSSQGVAFTGLTDGPYLPAMYARVGNTGGTWNFGQRDFEAGPNTGGGAPSGYKALCTANFDTPTIEDPSTVMDVVTYTGTGSSQTITLPGTGFDPDFIWIKKRSAAANNVLYDAVRGFGPSATKTLYSDLTNSEDTTSVITSTTSTGFNLSGSGSETNQSSATYVGWCWDAGTSTASNTSGSITSQVRANISAGFSVITYNAGSLAPATGATVGHGLGVAPEFIVVKDRTSSNPWGIYHTSLGPGKGMLFSSAAVQVASTWWDNTAPTSSVFSINSDIYATAQPNNDYVAYCWTPVEGYSAFGTYGGNSSSDGPFIFCGFRPQYVMVKATNGVRDWMVWDSARVTYNVNNATLSPNTSAAELTPGYQVDFLSNGFKLRASTQETNNSAYTYLYCAFAKNPFKYARAA